MTTEPQRVVVSGSFGFLGSNVVEYPLRKGDAVLSLDKAEPCDAANYGLPRRVDILDSAGINRAAAALAPDPLSHLAARIDLESRNLAEHPENIDGMRDVTRAANTCYARERSVYASSDLEFLLDQTVAHKYKYNVTIYYGMSKIRGEGSVRAQGVLHVAGDRLPDLDLRAVIRSTVKRFFTSVENGQYRYPRRWRLLMRIDVFATWRRRWLLKHIVTNVTYAMAPTAEVVAALPFSIDEGAAKAVARIRRELKSSWDLLPKSSSSSTWSPRARPCANY